MKYSDLNLTINNNTIKVNDNINVLEYLPIEDKYSIIYLALQNAEENGEYNLIKLQMYYQLYMVYMYSNLEFTDEEKQNESKVYDELKSNGILDGILAAIPASETIYCDAVLKETLDAKRTYRNTVASVIHGFINDLPKNANMAKDIISQFNPEDFQQVIDFARAANGGRPIN